MRQQVDAVMRATRVVTAAVAHSLAAVEGTVSLPQLRVLVMVHAEGPLNLSAVADGLGVNPSNASRTCERLVSAGLLHRREHPPDRRHVSLTLTREGKRLVSSVMRQRRAVLAQVVRQMAYKDRQSLETSLQAFVEAAGRVSDQASPGQHGHPLRWVT